MTLPVPMSLAVVGANFPNKAKGPTRRFEIAVCKPGDPIELRPEPENRADARAIAVYSEREVQLGYLRAEHALRLGRLWQAGHKVIAIFQEPTRYGAAIRVAFDGDVPVLPDCAPQMRISHDLDSGFWPDEEWPDK